MRRFLSLSVLLILITACAPAIPATLPPGFTPSPTFTPIPTYTPIPFYTTTPYATLGTISLDFIALLCNADWMNGAAHLTACPSPGADLSRGYAAVIDPLAEGVPAGTPVLLTVPGWDRGGALFLRYPSYTVFEGDRFRATLECRPSSPCDAQFALEYYDAKGKYHEFMKWDHASGLPPIQVDADLSALADQSVDFVLTIRLFHASQSPNQDNGIWIAPHIYRPSP